MFTLASKLLSTIAAPAFEKTYEKGCSIWDAKDELHKLQRSIQTVQAVLVDAENKQDTSAAVKDWVDRVKDVLYDADDLFSEVATDEMLKQQKEEKLLEKVQRFFSRLNPIVSRKSIANQVKNVRKRLLDISTDMAQFNFVICQYEKPISRARERQDPWSFVDSNDVIGRDGDKKVILEFLLDDKSNRGVQDVSVIAIVGIGGMGKTTLAQLVYNDEEVKKNFENSWYACVSDTSDDKEVIEKVFQSICKKNYGDFTLSQLQTEIRESIKGKKFLLVLDDLWDDDRGSWIKRMSLLNGGAKGSKIIITTRSVSVAKVMDALEVHKLEGLSERESWHLFKKIAFTSEQEKDPRWANLGREIVKKCANVPLAIRSVASLLCTKDTIEEWESFKDAELSKVELSGDLTMQTLKLSYDHLPSNLKPCFAYCSVFPKEHVFAMDDLIYLWIAQGYIKPVEEETVERVGYSYFMDLHKRYFFEKREDSFDGIFKKKYKMHDLIHDLAQCVAGEEIIVLTKPPNQLNERARHVSVGPGVDPSHMLNTTRLRSLLFLPRQDKEEDRQFTYGKYLRALSLSGLKVHIVSSCIGELKHLRYLNLSGIEFESLPDSLTNLLNLLTLDISYCDNLKALPYSFRKLINLRHLNIWGCSGLKYMPPGMGELTCLQNLSCFKVGKAIDGVQMSGLDVLAGFKLSGHLEIYFQHDIDNWDGDECWKLPVSLESLMIRFYPGRRIPNWPNLPYFLHNLSRLYLRSCTEVKYLPPLRCLPNLKCLHLVGLEELEYIEEEWEEDNRCTTLAAGYINNNASFFPLLEELQMRSLPRLKGWWRKVEATTASSAGSASPHPFLSFPLLSELVIVYCEELSSFPLCPCVRKLEIVNMDVVLMQQLLSTASTSTSPSSLLEDLKISNCDGLMSFEIEAHPYLVSLVIERCAQLESLDIAHLNALRELKVFGCPKELELWGRQQGKRCVDWDSLPNLSLLVVDRPPSYEELPDCLKRRHARGQFQIRRTNPSNHLDNEVIHNMDTSVQELPGALDLSPRKEIRPVSASSTSEIIPILKEHSYSQSDYDYPSPNEHHLSSHPSQGPGEDSHPSCSYGMDIDTQPASIPLTHHPDTDAAGWENQGESSNKDLTGRQVLELEKEMEGKRILFLFREGYEIQKEMLIQLWMALGILIDEPMEVIGANFFDKLVREGYILCSVAKSTYQVNNEKLNTTELDMMTAKQNYMIMDNGNQNDAASTETLHVSVVCDEIDTTTFKTLGRFNRLRALLFHGNYGSQLQKVPRDLFLCYESLVALDLSGTHIKELPSSANKMISLRFLDLSWTLIKLLPESIDRFKKLQTLKLKGCSSLHRLPNEMKGLTELRHLDLDVLAQLAAFPVGIGALVNLRTLSAFPIGTGEGLKISELKHLNNLAGEFCIANLENVQSADEAKDASLTTKRSIKTMELRWSDYQLQEPRNEDESILENLCPHSDLEEIQIICYPGTSFPGWIADALFQKLVSISLFKCEHISMLPSLGKLPSLKSLKLVGLNSVTKMDWRVGFDNVAFPVLQKLTVDEMYSLEVWIEAQESDYPCLTELRIKDCPKLLELPSLLYLPSLEHLELSGCDNLAFVSEEELSSSLQQLILEDCPLIKQRCSEEGGQDRHKIYHVPNIWIDQEACDTYHEEIVNVDNKNQGTTNEDPSTLHQNQMTSNSDDFQGNGSKPKRRSSGGFRRYLFGCLSKKPKKKQHTQYILLGERSGVSECSFSPHM